MCNLFKIVSGLSVIIIFGCTPKSKLLSIAQTQIQIANIPAAKPLPGNTISRNIEPKIIEKSGNTLKPATPIEGNLIQTGGSVEALALKLVVELDLRGSNVTQIIGIKNYIFKNWHYVNDPYKGKDTWRSAEVTIALRYKNKFPGDCDDFAILMASLAKQIGLRARMAGGYSGDNGHAFAEFLLPHSDFDNPSVADCDFRKDYSGNWISLDWFNGEEHNRFTHDINILEEP